jgi:GNAT superfamily N-acetyltransferase
MFAIRHECAADAVAVESLLDCCFGPDRLKRTSYRFRDGVPPLAELCFVAEGEAGRIVGAIRYWPLRLDERPALLLGPLAIDPERQRRGVGRALVFHSLGTAASAGHPPRRSRGRSRLLCPLRLHRRTPEHRDCPANPRRGSTTACSSRASACRRPARSGRPRRHPQSPCGRRWVGVDRWGVKEGCGGNDFPHRPLGTLKAERVRAEVAPRRRR